MAEGVREYGVADLPGHQATKNDARGYAHAVPSRRREAVELLCTSEAVDFRRRNSGPEKVLGHPSANGREKGATPAQPSPPLSL